MKQRLEITFVLCHISDKYSFDCQNLSKFFWKTNMVYKKDNYRDEFFGQSDNGNMLETGTYFYVIKLKQEDDTYGRLKKGWIYINRDE